MKNIQLLIALIYFSNYIFSQSIMDVGFRINSIAFNNQTNQFDNLNNPDNISNRNNQSFSFDLFYNFIFNKRIRPRIWGGYQIIKNSSNGSQNFSNGETQTYNGFQQISTYIFGTGAGKLISIDSLKIKFGPEIVFFYSQAEKTTLKVAAFDVNGNKFQTINTNIEQPPYYSIGAGIFATAYYPVWKNFSLGIELSNYFFYGKSKGNIKTEKTYFDSNGSQTAVDSETDKVDYSGINTSYFNISLGLSYQF